MVWHGSKVVGVWVSFAVFAVGVGSLLSSHRGVIIDKARTIDLEMAAIRGALKSYEAAFDGMPVGDSAAIFHALCGQNPKRAVFLDWRSGSVSRDGNPLDPWGTPYKVYFSSNKIVVRSAGPNRTFDASSQKQFDEFDDFIR